jgi:hypothetical protein
MKRGLAIAVLAVACGLLIGSVDPTDRAYAEEAANYPAFPVKIVVP